MSSPSTLVGSGGVDSVICLTVGIQESNNPLFDMIIYPNPSCGKINILFDELFFGRSIVKIYNSTGQIIYSDKISAFSASLENMYSLDISKEPRGVYFVQVANDTGLRSQKVILK